MTSNHFDLPPIVAILGPTAVGKSELAMGLALRFEGEIISADSRQVYRHLNIGTAKPSQAERRQVCHHLIDIVDLDARYTVVDFVTDARAVLRDISGRGRVAFVVGGTGHYARALLQSQSIPAVPPDEARRSEMTREVERRGAGAALARIRNADPATAERLDPSNVRRITRALEILSATGLPVPRSNLNPLPSLVMGLDMDRSALYERADNRVDRQVQAGLVEETSSILNMGFSPENPLLKGLGYSQIVQHLIQDIPLEQAIRSYKYATHGLIRKQLTWFRAEPRLQWVDASRSGLLQHTARLVDAYLGRKPAKAQ